MVLIAKSGFDGARASFITHFNYAKRLDHLLSGCHFSTKPTAGAQWQRPEINRFIKLYDVTQKSIKKDIELAREDSAFSTISAPWFPVKCYYALYYLEAILIHKLDGTSKGFAKGGHTAVRKKLGANLKAGLIAFSSQELNRVCLLTDVAHLPRISSGRNARSAYWKEESCTDSILRKLMEYKLHDAQTGNKWNLRTKKARTAKTEFMDRESLSPLDFFYWYRIKANYRDLDFIDFENGVTETEVLSYMETYYSAYVKYRNLLVKEINRLRKT